MHQDVNSNKNKNKNTAQNSIKRAYNFSSQFFYSIFFPSNKFSIHFQLKKIRLNKALCECLFTCLVLCACTCVRSTIRYMNAIIALCHFCEAHGPCPILCTHTLRDTKIDELLNNSGNNDNTCPGCNSIGQTVGILSQDSESNANFLTTQTAVITEIVPLVKQAATRSLSCEVSSMLGVHNMKFRWFLFLFEYAYNRWVATKMGAWYFSAMRLVAMFSATYFKSMIHKHADFFASTRSLFSWKIKCICWMCNHFWPRICGKFPRNCKAIRWQSIRLTKQNIQSERNDWIQDMQAPDRHDHSSNWPDKRIFSLTYIHISHGSCGWAPDA